MSQFIRKCDFGSLLAMLLLLTLISACQDQDDAAFKGGVNESKPRLREELKGLDQAKGTRPKEPVVKTAATATYDMRITTVSGVKLCTGEATLDIKSDLTISFPDTYIQCLSYRVDLAGLLKQASSKTKANATSDGKILYQDRIGGAQFEPARPFLIGPVIQNSDQFKDLKHSATYKVNGTGPKGSYQDSGRINLAVLGVDQSFERDSKDIAFDKIIHWQMEATGYGDDIPKSSAYLFNKIEFYWNTRPIMIPKIVIESPLSDFLGASGANAPDIIGVLKVVLLVKSYDFK
jgi:hypothetical protein